MLREESLRLSDRQAFAAIWLALTRRPALVLTQYPWVSYSKYRSVLKIDWQATMTSSPGIKSSLRLPLDIIQPFPLRFRRDDLHVMAFFDGHPQYEAVEAMIRVQAGNGYSIRAIITRHDQSQIDHLNDDALLADFRGAERQLCRREIDFETGSSGAGRRAQLAFLSQAGERIVLDVVTVGQPDPKHGGLIDPGGHSARSALPIMWRGASTLAGPQTKVTIDGVEYGVPEKIRAGTFIAHEGYFTERYSMGVIRAGTVTTRLLKKPDRFDVGAEWVKQCGERTTTYRVTAKGADGALRIAKLDGSDEIITAYAIGGRLEVTRISLGAEAGPTGGLVLGFDCDAGFGLSIEEGQDIVTGRLQIVERSDGLLVSLGPLQPNWAIDRVARVACSMEGDQIRLVTTIGPP